MIFHAAHAANDVVHAARMVEWAACRAVVAFTALCNGFHPTTEEPEPNPLWALAEENGWTLDDFVHEVLTMTDSVTVAAVDKGAHASLEHDCPCLLIREIRATV